MNFYKRHLGDYAKDTGHLSPLEHGVFTLLLDWYYASEQPIPADKAYRVAKATTKTERQAADNVLADFFTREGDVWTNKRADVEIAAAHAQAETNRRIAEEREAKRKASRTVHESLHEKATKERGGSGEPSQTPDSTSQTPQDQDQERERASGATQRAAKRAPKDFALTDDMRQWATAECPGIDIAAETAKFVDHTFSTARSDWPATWRNWIRRARESRQSRTAPVRSKHDLSGMDYSKGVNANGTF